MSDDETAVWYSYWFGAKGKADPKPEPTYDDENDWDDCDIVDDTDEEK